MKEMNKKNYVSPMVEILNARVEKGFQTSTGAPVDPDFTTTETVPQNPEGDMGEFD